MNERIARKLDAGKKLLLSAAVVLALAIPIGFGLMNATQGRAQAQEESTNATKFTVSVKPSELSTPTYAGSGVHMVRMMYGPNGFESRNTNLLAIMQEAYGVQADQIPGAPEVVKTAAYDIEIKAEGSAGSSQPMDPLFRQNEIRGQLRSLLTERFKLVLHHETKVLPSYLLEVGENGSKLQPTKYPDTPDTAAGPDGKSIHRMMMRQGGNGQVMGIGAQKSSMAEFARQLSMQLAENVIDKTGLTGQYDFNLQWSQSAGNDSLVTAVQEQLGLKLVPQQAPADVLVIDHLELPEADASR